MIFLVLFQTACVVACAVETVRQVRVARFWERRYWRSQWEAGRSVPADQHRRIVREDAEAAELAEKFSAEVKRALGEW